MIIGEHLYLLVAVVTLILCVEMKAALGSFTTSGAGDDAKVRCIERERHALLQFKEGISYDYGLLSSWGSTKEMKDCCKWRGVQCNNITGHVVTLDLRASLGWYNNYQHLKGEISPSLLELQHLKYLDLSCNDFEGRHIPEFIGSFTRLRYLNLSNANVVGKVPNQIGNLSKLRSLDLDQGIENNGSLYVKNLEWLSHLSLLRYLDLSRVDLSKAIDWMEAINKLPLLTEFHLIECRLSVVISPSLPLINSSASLVVLDLSGNSLTSSIYSWLFNFSTTHLDFSSNQLEGGIPKSFGNLNSLRILYLGYNELTGKISEFLQILSRVAEKSLEILDLTANRVGGSLPDNISTFSSLKALYLEENQLSGPLPGTLGQLRNLISLYLANNQLIGTLPKCIGQLSMLESLDVAVNFLEGPIPLVLPNVTYLDLSSNKFSGSISFLCSTINENLRFFDLSDNHLSGKLPDCWMHMKELVVFDLANNNLFGKIPQSLGFLTQVQTLHLRKNNFIGELPPSLKNCRNLLVIDVGENKLSGHIPEWIGTHLTSLIVLSLRLNKFQGYIPPNICHLNSIQILDLSQNSISGIIPHCFNNFTTMVSRNKLENLIFYDFTGHDGSYYFGRYIDSALVLWKGQEYKYQTTLGLVRSIDLSSNSLVGKFPKEISSLAELVSLNLSRNSLTGHVIQKIGELKMLESLDLSRNQLSGEIPTDITRLNFLGVLDLSNNNLSGKIPSSTQLQSFYTSAYAGNHELCGLPLPNKCPGDETTLDPSVTNRVKTTSIKEMRMGL
ncbi:receptor-like protein EIX1 [Cornus florida]|uniref:receptor-like protein EIX1 n=1 Tax=Cornus florida TaxID=4283 RepID=UPI002897BA73|nr:receptor-like protein EIX1 [Cornus florida]